MFPLHDENPTERTPFVTWTLIIANIAVFLWQWHVGLEKAVRAYGFTPMHLQRGDGSEVLHVLTSMFMHGGILHIAGNLWFLHIFGDNLEEEMGHFWFLLFYLMCGFSAVLAHYFSNPTSPLPCVGASGAISGVLGGYLLLHPDAPIRTWTGIWFAPIIRIPAILFLGIWAIFQFISATAKSSSTAGGVAYWAHIGGLVAGLIFVNMVTSNQRRRPERIGW
jgi:membrane associated rhomboid family serine protease